MPNGFTHIPLPPNEPIFGYGPGSPERTKLDEALGELSKGGYDVPLIIGGQEIRTGDTADIKCPHNHQLKLGVYHKGGEEHVKAAAEACRAVAKSWADTPWEERASVFLKAAELLATKYRYVINAATMLGQSKNAFQAEIDSACELADFWRFNSHYATYIYNDQPSSPTGLLNRVEYRPLEGFVFAVTPFNFTSIAGNLPTAPALMGGTAIWKPASSSMFSAYFLMQLLKEAGLPDGVINMVPGPGASIGTPAMKHPDLAGIHFTGSTGTFQTMWRTVGENIANYKSYPRIVGETGGKDYIFVHPSADMDAVLVAAVRGAFEYQGQKCSAASRMYVPKSLWPALKERMIEEIKTIKVGNPAEYSTFMGAVIDKAAFASITSYIEYAKKADDADIVAGGTYDDSVGWFVDPTVIETSNPYFKTMSEEIFGPVLTVHPYDDDKIDETIGALDKASPYALTGAIFARDRLVISHLKDALANTAGNFYINDKPTGAVVGQQPFGGGRASGTNDKAGSYLNLLRWVSVRTVKENFVPPTADYRYPYMKD